MAAFGRHYKRGGAACGRATSGVVSFVLALSKVNIVAVTTILVLHASTGRSEHVCLDIMFVAIRASCSLAVRAMRACAQGGQGALPPRRGVWGSFRPPPRKQLRLGGRRPPNSKPRQAQNRYCCAEYFAPSINRWLDHSLPHSFNLSVREALTIHRNQ